MLIRATERETMLIETVLIALIGAILASPATALLVILTGLPILFALT